MRTLKSIYHFFPVQLLLLHIKKFQILLVFWLILFSTLNGGFMKSYGAGALFLSPEYLGAVSAASFAIVGAAMGIFIMSWNITTFILFCRHFRFLATTTKPFLKYCINNAGLPLIFLVFYFIKAVQFSSTKELLPADIRMQVQARWVAEAERAFRDNETTFAIVPLAKLMRADGYAAQLRAKGYVVDVPR